MRALDLDAWAAPLGHPLALDVAEADYQLEHHQDPGTDDRDPDADLAGAVDTARAPPRAARRPRGLPDRANGAAERRLPRLRRRAARRGARLGVLGADGGRGQGRPAARAAGRGVVRRRPRRRGLQPRPPTGRRGRVATRARPVLPAASVTTALIVHVPRLRRGSAMRRVPAASVPATLRRTSVRVHPRAPERARVRATQRPPRRTPLATLVSVTSNSPASSVVSLQPRRTPGERRGRTTGARRSRGGGGGGGGGAVGRTTGGAGRSAPAATGRIAATLVSLPDGSRSRTPTVRVPAPA